MQSSTTGLSKDSAEKVVYKDKHSPERLTSHRSGETRGRRDSIDLRKKDQETKRFAIIHFSIAYILYRSFDYMHWYLLHCF